MRTDLSRSNTPGLATAALLSSLGVAASAQESKASFRQMAEELCGQQLAAFEATAGEASSLWQGPAATTEVPVWMSPASARVRVWHISALALVVPVMNAKVAGDSPEYRSETVGGLRAALALSNCLTPTDIHWRGAEFPADDTHIPEDQSFMKEMQSTECFVELSEDLLELLVSDLEGVALKYAIEEQVQLHEKPCGTEE